MALTSGTRLGPYEITSQIRVGGMGEVYRAQDTKLKRQVAVKVLPESAAGSERDAQHLVPREAEVLAQKAPTQTRILMSSGLATAYAGLLPACEERTGEAVVTARVASMGTFPPTIPNRLGRGKKANVLILVGAVLHRTTRGR